MLSWCGKLAQKTLARPWRLAAAGPCLALLAFLGFLGWRHLGAWHEYRAAQHAVERRDFAEARKHLQACLEVWPGSAATHFLAARTARRADRLDEALEHLETCTELGGEAEAIVLEEYLIRAQRGKLADVENKLLACLSQDHPDSPFILEVLTGQMMKENRLHEALAYLDQWLERRPADRLALVRRGWVREHLLDLEGAAQAYRQALEIDPEQDRVENDRVRLRLGQLLVQKYRAEQALRHFETMHQRQPHNPEVLLGLVRCYRQLKSQGKTRELLDAFLAEHPDNGQALGERGRLALDLGHPAEAEPWLRRAATLCPHDRPILSNFFKCLSALAKKTEAEKLSARLNQIRADERRMNRLIREALKSPRDAELLCEVGTIFLRNGLTDDGTRWLATALIHNPRHGPSHQALTDHYTAAGQPDRAAPHRRALEDLAREGGRLRPKSP